jgi:hypothetical protein
VFTDRDLHIHAVQALLALEATGTPSLTRWGKERGEHSIGRRLVFVRNVAFLLMARVRRRQELDHPSVVNGVNRVKPCIGRRNHRT